MLTLLLLLFLVMVVVDIWAAVIVIDQSLFNARWRALYAVIVFLALAAAFAITSFFSYYPNSNTHVFGWPVPRVVFQRDTPTSPWLDYVGPTIVLAYPMNFVIYMSIPSIVYAISDFRRRNRRDGARS